MTKAEMAEYLSKHRREFPEYSDAEIDFVLNKWNGECEK